MSFVHRDCSNRKYKFKRAPDGRTWVQIAIENGINITTFYNRIRTGLTPEQAAFNAVIRGVEKTRMLVENRIKAKELGVENLLDLYMEE